MVWTMPSMAALHMAQVSCSAIQPPDGGAAAECPVNSSPPHLKSGQDYHCSEQAVKRCYQSRFRVNGRLETRPVYHYLEDRVRACCCACWPIPVQRTMERALAPLLFKDEAIPSRDDPVARRHAQLKPNARTWPSSLPKGSRCTASEPSWPCSAVWSRTG